MGGTLPDGCVAASYFSVGGGGTAPNPNLCDTSLRWGTVTEIRYPGKKNRQEPVKYKVRVLKYDGGGQQTHVDYYPCIVSNIFGGGLADRCIYTLRNEGDEGVGMGAQVLLLCIGGTSADAVIIGGIQMSDKTTQVLESEGHHFDFEFNGFQLKINKDGEGLMRFSGATNFDGSLVKGVDSNNGGSNLNFTKDGNVLLQTGSAEGCTLNLSARNKIVMEHQEGVIIGGENATDRMPLFETYRKEEKSFHDSLKKGLEDLGKALTTLASSSVPPYTAQLASGFTEASQYCTQMAEAISTFEKGADKYVSKKNMND